MTALRVSLASFQSTERRAMLGQVRRHDLVRSCFSESVMWVQALMKERGVLIKVSTEGKNFSLLKMVVTLQGL